MPDSGLEREKDELIQRLTEAYSRSEMDMQAFEVAVNRVSGSSDSLALKAEVASLGMTMPALPVPRSGAALEAASAATELDCVSGSLRREGDWVRTGIYRIRLKSSSARLDFSAYESVRGFRLVIELEARSSSLLLIVPSGFEIEDLFSENISSAVRNRPKAEPFGDNRILLRGALRSSSVKVRYRR